jgi:hypothetical protein
MVDRTILVTLSGAVVLLLAVLEMVRRRRLREEYALGWLLAAVVMLGLAGSRGALDTIAGLLGVYYPPSALIVVGLGLGLVVALHFSAAVSQLSEENTTLAQELAILRWQVQRIEQAHPRQPDDPNSPAGR